VNGEQEELEALQKWWRENGKVVVAGVVLGLGGVFGWTSWQSYQERQATQASQLYNSIVESVLAQEHAAAQRQTDLLVSEHRDSGYASLASLVAAKSAVARGEPDAAEKRLRWVIENADLAELRDLARIRLARLLRDEQRYDEGLTVLDQLQEASFVAIAAELRGDFHLAMGDREAARRSYEAALAAPGIDAGMRARLQMKHDDLGRTQFATETP